MDPKDWIQLALFGLQVGNIVYMRMVSVGAARQKDFEEHRRQIRDQELRITMLESKIQSMPTMEAFHKLELSVSNIAGGMRVIEAELKPIVLALARVEKFLLDNSGANSKVRNPR